MVLVISRVDVLVGSLLTFGCFHFSLGSWYHLFDEYSPSEVGCSTPSDVGISSPSEVCVKFFARVILEWTLGACWIASGLVGVVDVWCGTVVVSSGKVSS